MPTLSPSSARSVRIPAAIPPDWRRQRLVDCCRPRQWPTIKKADLDGGQYSVYGANGLIDWHSLFSHSKETVTVTCRGATCGTINIVPAMSYVTGNAMALDAMDPTVDHRFLAASLDYRGLTDAIEGSAQPQITRAGLRGVRIPLPPLPEQKKIAAILSSVDEAIQATQAVIEQTRRVKEGLLQDLLTRGMPGHTRFKQTEIGEIPVGWEVRRLGELIRHGRPICYGILKPGKGVAGGVPVVKVKNIKGGVIHDDDLLLTGPEIDAAYKRSKLLPGDVLVSIRGTTGRVAIVAPSLEKANITQDTARLSINKDKTTNLFVYYALQSRRLQQYITLHTIGQAVKGINIAEVRKIPVALPSIDEQGRIIEVISAVQNHVWREVEKLARLQQVKAGLLKDLRTGNVRVSP